MAEKSATGIAGKARDGPRENPDKGGSAEATRPRRRRRAPRWQSCASCASPAEARDRRFEPSGAREERDEGRGEKKAAAQGRARSLADWMKAREDGGHNN